MKIEEMADVFLNLANFVPHAFLNLAPPSGFEPKIIDQGVKSIWNT